MEASSHLSAGKEIRISLDPGDDLTQDNAVGEHIRLGTVERKHLSHCNRQNVSKIISARSFEVENLLFFIFLFILN